eukprot:scaffold44614_cov73-Attheya_sp.AAC.4
MHWHVKDTHIILDEGTFPHPQCEHCDMFVPRPAVYTSHRNTAMCKDGGADRKRQRLVRKESQQATEQVLMARGVPLWTRSPKSLQSPKELGKDFTYILARDGATPRVSGMFYKVVVQSILLFGSTTWVVTKPMLQALEGFHHRVARRLAGKQPYFCRETDEWIYPPIEKVLEEVGLWPIEKYTEKFQNTVADYVPHGLFSNSVPTKSGQTDPNRAEDGGSG